MDRISEGRFTIAEGTDVYGSDGDKVGEVVAVQPNYIVVEKGFFFPTDYYIPTSAVATTDEDGKVYLSVTKDEALNQGWDAAPADDDYVATGATDETFVAGTAAGTAGYTADMGATDVAAAGTADTGTTRVADAGTLRVPVHEEEWTATGGAWGMGDRDTIEIPIHFEEIKLGRESDSRTEAARAWEPPTPDPPIVDPGRPTRPKPT